MSESAQSGSVDTIVIGGGVIGIAIAAQLAMKGSEVLLLEKGGDIGTGISSRNSEVIHAGIYYRPGSLKARLCLEGKERLYRYCQSHGIAHRQTGKLIVATEDDERDTLRVIAANARTCGLDDLDLWDRSRLQRAAPQLSAVEALYSPSSGIVDGPALMLALRGDLERAGGMIAFHAPVERVSPCPNGYLVDVAGPDGMQLECRRLINAAGFGATEIASVTEGFPSEVVPTLYLAKGNYFSLAASPPCELLVYPVPADGGLGIHMTLDLAGRARFGPDVEWVDKLDYTVDPARTADFEAAVRRWWPALPDDRIHPDYSGIRPKLTGPGQPPADFMILGERDHGLPAQVHLFGMESPGLTASLAVAAHVERMLS